MLQLFVLVLWVAGSYGCPPAPVSDLLRGPFTTRHTPGLCGPHPPQDDSAKWRLFANKPTIPPACDKSNCSFYLAIGINDHTSSYLDFAMEANAKGWLAVGFAPQPVMVCMPAPRLYVPVRILSIPRYSPMLTSLPVW